MINKLNTDEGYTELQRQFHRAQQRLKRQEVVAPLFSAEVICTDDAPSNFERRAEYEHKLHQREMVRLDNKRLSACRFKAMRRIARNRIEDRRAAA